MQEQILAQLSSFCRSFNILKNFCFHSRHALKKQLHFDEIVN